MTARSMTGFGQAEVSRGGVRAAVEVRTVNHRFLDFKVKLPRAWASLEQALGGRVKAQLGRGRVDVSIRREAEGAAATEVVVDGALARSVHDAASTLADELGLEARVDLGFLLSVHGVLTTREADVSVDDEADMVIEALDKALGQVVSMREQEGVALVSALDGQLDEIQALSEQIATIAVEVPGAVRSRLERRIGELLKGTGVALDPERVAQEVALLADKAAIDEELARIASHVAQARSLLQESDEPVGRRLEFLAQEFGREINTIGSKSAETSMSALVVELKSTLEKLREQSANVE